MLCNAYLDTFGRAMLAAGYRVIRYSGDMAIPVPDKAAAERVLADAADALEYLRLDLVDRRGALLRSRGDRLVVEHQDTTLLG